MVHRLLCQRLGREVHTEIDPELCVALGAAVQGALISGIDVGPVLVDITPHTLGIQVLGELHGFPSAHYFSPIIQRNTPLPASRSELYTTAVDGQEAALISVYQGESEDVRHNQPVGQFVLEGLADVRHGNEILVRFDLSLLRRVAEAGRRHRRRALTHLRAGRLAEATREAQRHYALEPKAETGRLLAVCHALRGNWPEALALLRRWS